MKQTLLLTVLLSLISFNARAEFPAFDFNEVPVVRFADPGYPITNSASALKLLDTQIARALVSHRGQRWAYETFLTYRAFANNEVGTKPKKVSPLVSALIGQSDDFDGYSNPTGDARGVTGFEVFVADRLRTAPITMRFLVVHESLGHLSQMLKILNDYGPATTAEWFENKTQRSIDFIKFTHMTASLMEAQMIMMIPFPLLIQDLKQSQMDEKTKTFYATRYTRLYEMGAANYVVARARGEACPKAQPQCITDDEARIMINHFKKLGFTLFGR